MLSSRQLRDRRDRVDIVERQAVAGVDLDPVLGGERGGVGQAAEFGRLRLARQFGVTAGVELDHRRAEAGSPRRSGAASGSMNRLTRMPASPSARTIGAR